MPCLVLDTSSDLCLTAIVKEQQPLAQKIFSHQNQLSKLLLPEIQSLIQQTGLKPADLDTIAVGVGPGSYTGTRLSVAVGKSLAFGLQIPLISFSSPLAFLPNQNGIFAFLIPTRSGEIFVLKGTSSETVLDQKSATMITPDNLTTYISDCDFIVGSSLESASFAKPLFSPKPNLLKLAQFLSKKELTPPENVELLYLHTPF